MKKDLHSFHKKLAIIYSQPGLSQQGQKMKIKFIHASV